MSDDDSVVISKASNRRPSISVNESDSGSVNLRPKRDRPSRRPKHKTHVPPRRSPPFPSKTPVNRAPPELNAFVNARKEAPIAEEESEDEGHDEGGDENVGDPYGIQSQAQSMSMQDDMAQGGYASSMSSAETEPQHPYKSLREEQEALLLKLYNLRKQGRDVPDVDFHTEIHELRFIYKRLEDDASTETGTDLAKHALIFSVGMIEMLNETYNPFDLHLKDFSHDVMLAQKGIEPILRKLVEKYKSNVTPPPELSLILTLVSIGAGTHMRNAKKSRPVPQATYPAQQPARPTPQPMPNPGAPRGPQATNMPPARTPMPAPAFAPPMMPGSLMPFAMNSRDSAPARNELPNPLQNRLAPNPPPPRVTPQDQDDDRGSDVITEMQGVGAVDNEDAASVSTEASTRTRARRKRTKAAPQLDGKVVII